MFLFFFCVFLVGVARTWAEDKERLLQRVEELKDDVDSNQLEFQAALDAVKFQERDVLDDGKHFRDAGTNAYRPGGRGNGGESAQSSTQKSSSTESVSSGRNERDLEAQNSLADMYREQCIKLEDELCRMKEVKEASKEVHGERNKKLFKRLAMMKTRCVRGHMSILFDDCTLAGL